MSCISFILCHSILLMEKTIDLLHVNDYLYQVKLQLMLSRGIYFVFMVFNTTFTNISVISWRSVFFVEELEDPERTTDLLQVTDKLYHIIWYTSPWSRFKLTPSVVIGTNCIGSCESNYHTIMAVFTEIFATLHFQKYLISSVFFLSHVLVFMYKG